MRNPEASFINFTVNPPPRSGLSIFLRICLKYYRDYALKVEDTFIVSRGGIIRTSLLSEI
jgi:hypothetical protein